MESRFGAMTILLPNKVGAANAGWPSQFRFRGLRHRPGMADLVRCMSPIPIHGAIPRWRIALWSLLFMVGVYFLGRPEGHPIWGWVCVLLAGVFMAWYCLYLNWMQTDRARYWRLEHPVLIRRLRFLPRLLIKLRIIKPSRYR